MAESDARHKHLRDETIKDFGRQWTTYTDNKGYYGSSDLLADIVEPLLPIGELRNATVADIGSGSGRIVQMLIQAGVAKVYAVEPSQAFETLKRNTAENASQIVLLNLRGDQLPADLNLDFVLSIGVVHHIPHPEPVLSAAYAALRPGGRVLLWLYGMEGNEAYLAVFGPLRRVTRQLPHALLAPLCHAINLTTELYIAIASFVRVPMREYIRNVFGRFDRRTRYLAIYDQLNPHYAKYHKRDEAIDLLRTTGFKNVQAHHRHGYSWTVIGTKPGVP